MSISSKFQLRSSTSLLLLVALMVVMGMDGAAAAPNTNFVSSACNTQKIPSGNPFFTNLRAMLADLKQNTAFSGFDYKTSRAGSGGAPTAYGRAICKSSISQSDCSACLSNLVGRIWGICSNAIGARVQLTDCFIQYEQHSF
uniref:Antifungal protein ginkbilobin-like protein 1 n=1 Tax=Picea glauca TaxID=3330 RepID=GNKL1_PICGL|nr:RecName: Full=Antifungal protein ginkbilobin-like protein 1; AltName: Full=Embryo-abundant protein 24; Flags: Precursor [Picea glauca]AAB01559.1 embryo-abundant protein [Picea glauca]